MDSRTYQGNLKSLTGKISIDAIFFGRTGWPDTESEEFHTGGMAELPRIRFGHERGNLSYATLALIKWPKYERRKK